MIVNNTNVEFVDKTPRGRPTSRSDNQIMEALETPEVSYKMSSQIADNTNYFFRKVYNLL